jgi:hypothetical protein
MYAETVFSFLTTWGPRSCKISIMSHRKRALKYKSISSFRQELHRRCNLLLHRTAHCKGRNLHRWQKYPLPIVHKTVERRELSAGCNIDIAQPKTPSLVHHMHIVRPKSVLYNICLLFYLLKKNITELQALLLLLEQHVGLLRTTKKSPCLAA